MTEKSPNAFRTISEVSDAIDVPAHVLRFWESKFTQIKPVKRGGGRRYYRPSDVDLIRGIRDLLYAEGLTIKGVQKILRQKGARHVVRIGNGEIDPWTPTVAMSDVPVDEPMVEFAEQAALFENDRKAPAENDTPLTTEDLAAMAKEPVAKDTDTKTDLPLLPVNEQVLARLAEIADDETRDRDELRSLVRRFEAIADRMRHQ